MAVGKVGDCSKNVGTSSKYMKQCENSNKS